MTVIFSRSFRVQAFIPLFFSKFSGSTGIDHTVIYHTECTLMSHRKWYYICLPLITRWIKHDVHTASYYLKNWLHPANLANSMMLGKTYRCKARCDNATLCSSQARTGDGTHSGWCTSITTELLHSQSRSPSDISSNSSHHVFDETTINFWCTHTL